MIIDTTNTYPVPSHEATLRLETFLTRQISENGPISFHTYMQHALYHPEWGYYTRGFENIGKSGDFFTSVSVGACFGTILAHRIHKLWIENESPSSYHIIEIAANNGQLAKDILNTIQQSFPDFYQALTYHIIEHLNAAKAIQRLYLNTHEHKIAQHSSPSEISETTGVILSNELIDSFPVQLLQLENNQWHERLITIEDEKLTFLLDKKLSPELVTFTEKLPSELIGLPDGYQTEYRPGIDTFIADITEMLENFHTITIDYGHTHDSYYAASRSTGTLCCYFQHQADEKPLDTPGLKDITAHVDFTLLGKAYLQHGHQITHFSSQSHYLTTHAKDWLISLEENLNPNNFKLIRQFQTLTHPTTMGHQFHVLETAHFKASHNKTDSVALEKLELKSLSDFGNFTLHDNI